MHTFIAFSKRRDYSLNVFAFGGSVMEQLDVDAAFNASHFYKIIIPPDDAIEQNQTTRKPPV
jgi:hypothetical protein